MSHQNVTLIFSIKVGFKTEKVNITMVFSIIHISLGTKFQLKLF